MTDLGFKDLRAKLDAFGFNQTLPVLAIPLVEALFADLVKTTERLRDSKRQVMALLDEKTCWDMGVEPYKCDNSRLLAECNELHLQFIKEREDYEQRLCDAVRRLRILQTDKDHLQNHNTQLQSQLDTYLTKQVFTSATNKRTLLGTSRQTKKPFISTVRSGEVLPAAMHVNAGTSALKCTKCNAGVAQKITTTTKEGVTITHTNTAGIEEVDKLQNELKSSGEQLEFYKRKVESRNREIRRLNDMLVGGRPPVALAKDCCFRDMGVLSQDIDLLQREKSELMVQIQEYKEKMHDAMQRALKMDEDKRKTTEYLEKVKKAALQVEQEANAELDARDAELRALKTEVNELYQELEQRSHPIPTGLDKCRINERLNVLTRREEELEMQNDKQKRKLLKMQAKMLELQKNLRDQLEQGALTLDEEKVRLKSERDFFQKEYLRLISKTGSESEVAFLQSQIKSKDDELRALRSELCPMSVNKLQFSPRRGEHCESVQPPTACSATSSSTRTDCVQAAIGRVERERDCARVELERIRCERDTLREKQLSSVQLHAEELQTLRHRNEELQERIRKVERDNRDLNSARVPAETHNVFLKEDVAQLKQRLQTLQAETEDLRKENTQITLINEQNERIIADYQSKLLIAERKLHNADARFSTVDSSRETNRNEATQLRNEIGTLRQTYIALENEKDVLTSQLDKKTEQLFKLEFEMKDFKEIKTMLELKVKELESQVDKLTSRTRQRDSELNETSAESKTLRQQIVALKASRDEAIAENGRLTDKLSDVQVELKTVQKKLKDSEQQVANMKEQLHKYVQEVKRAEDLLMKKEKDREELLDHYNNLTHDQVALEGNNQSLEFEVIEFKRQICELESEIRSLKDQLCCRQCTIDDLDMQLTANRASMRCLQRELENAREQKIELDVRKELCDKLDVEKDKLNAELNELNEIRKKLEQECEKLRAELQQKSILNQVTKETTGQILEKVRSEHRRQDDEELKAKLEMERLRELHEKALHDLQVERERCNQQELVANQYEEQARELRHRLAEDRFCEARRREATPKHPPKTL